MTVLEQQLKEALEEAEKKNKRLFESLEALEAEYKSSIQEALTMLLNKCEISIQEISQEQIQQHKIMMKENLRENTEALAMCEKITQECMQTIEEQNELMKKQNKLIEMQTNAIKEQRERHEQNLRELESLQRELESIRTE